MNIRKAIDVLSLSTLLAFSAPIMEAQAQAKTCSTSVAAANTAILVTPSDATVYNPPSRGLYIGGIGSVKVRLSATQLDVTFTDVPTGTILPVCVDMVYTTGTTATAIVMLK